MSIKDEYNKLDRRTKDKIIGGGIILLIALTLVVVGYTLSNI